MERVSLTDQVVHAIREEILDGALPPGTSLREAALTERFEVSRSTVREAIKSLVGEGLVTHEHHRGAIVRVHTAADVEDLLVARLVVERAVGAAGPAEYLGAAAELERMRRAVSRHDWRAAARADEAFHHALVAALGSPRLAVFHGQLQAELRLLLVTADREQPEENKVDEHAQLLALARAGEEQAYLRAAVRHVTRARPTLLKVAGAATVSG